MASNLSASSPTNDHNTTSTGVFPAELLDRIIDHLHDDKPTLRTLALVCKQTFVTSRTLLNLELEFAKDDWKFDLFLEYMEVPWSSLTYAIRSIHLTRLPFGSSTVRRNGDAPRIADNLSSVKTLRITAINWLSISSFPNYIYDLLFLLKISHFHIESIGFTKDTFVDFFARLQPSVKFITMLCVRLSTPNGIPTLASSGRTFLRPFHFRMLDTQSLLHFEKVWDPLQITDLKVTVDSFMLRLCGLYSIEGQDDPNTAFISRFIHHVGPSLRHLYINIADREGDPYSLQHLESVDVSQCNNLRILHIGTIEMDHNARPNNSHEGFLLSVVWELLSKLASSSSSEPHRLEEIVFLFSPFTKDLNDAVSGCPEVQSFPWVEFAGRLQSLFKDLKAIQFAVGYHSFNVGERSGYEEAFKQALGTKDLTEKGIVSFHTVPWEASHPDLTWRSIPTSNSFHTSRTDT